MTNIIDKIIPWLITHGVKIAAIIIAAYLVRVIIKLSLDKVIRKAIITRKGVSAAAEKRREDTLIRVSSSALKIIVWLVAIMMITSEAGVDIGPMIAAAGIIGIALGFGGQYLVRDLISGLFIILENQYRVGDVVKIAGVAGKVEDINLRMTILRDADGVVHHVPNGEIKTASNLTKQFSKVNLDIGIGYDADLSKAREVVNTLGKEMIKESEWKDKLKTAPEFLRVNELGDSAVVIRISAETEPLSKWEVAGELRERVKLAFDKAGIDIPYPQMVVRNK